MSHPSRGAEQEPPATPEPAPTSGGSAALDAPAALAGVSFRWPFRRYQRLALEGYERGLAADRQRSYIVMPPGSGKTVVGLEIARLRGDPTLVLCPNTAVQAQWLRQWNDFRPRRVPVGASPGLETPLTVLTYQALCNFDPEHEGIDDQALEHWRDELRRTRGLSVDQADAEIAALKVAGGRHYRTELARHRRRARALIARGGDHAELLSLLHPNGRTLIERMRHRGRWTLVLDECHHLLEMWGQLIRAVVEELGGGVFVLGLTATPPAELDPRSATLYHSLFGDADLEVPTPAVVKEGDLAPYQELVYLTRPPDHETAFIAAQHVRFEEMLARLFDPDFATVPFLDWVRVRVGARRGRGGARMSWARFERDEPDVARAALRVLHERGFDLPEGARLREQHRRAPDADDWVALIGDYCVGHLQRSADARDVAAWDEIRRALPSLGYVLTRRGIRRHAAPVDRVLALSASKPAAALEILGVERDALGPDLRALVLCDYERAGAEVLARLRGVLDPQAGSAALALHILAGAAGLPELNPILMTGRTVACARATAASLIAWLEARVPELAGTFETARLFEPAAGDDGRHVSGDDWDAAVVARPEHSWWRPRNYVPLITRFFEEGGSRCLIGTRGLLGEGWDARRVNVLVDLTGAATATSVHQMRGRSIRLDPALPRKVANNWDVVCVDSDHPRGSGDYARFVRKHRHYYAPTPEGRIESGVSHVHPRLSPFGPPSAGDFDAINQGMLVRAADRDGAYARWRVGEPYENRESHTVRIRFGRSIGLPNRRPFRRANAERLPMRRDLFVAAGVGGVAASMALVFSPGTAGASLATAALVGTGLRIAYVLRRVLTRLRPSDALEDFAAAVAEALAATGGVPHALGPEHVRLIVEEDGYYRCELAGATADESRLFTESLDELLAPLVSPRYIIPRYVAEPPRSGAAALVLAGRLLLADRTGARMVYHAVPSYLAANRKRVAAFERAWRRHVSRGEALYRSDPRAQGILEVQRGEDLFDTSTQMRVVWN